MKRYKFCSHGNDEAISVISASGIEEATEIFAGMKKLSQGKFLKLYKVVEISEKNTPQKR